jgi:hypothetical protein
MDSKLYLGKTNESNTNAEQLVVRLVREQSSDRDHSLSLRIIAIII